MFDYEAYEKLVPEFRREVEGHGVGVNVESASCWLAWAVERHLHHRLDVATLARLCVADERYETSRRLADLGRTR